MEIISTQKFIRTSPQKLREVVAVIKSMPVNRALDVLPFVGKRAAEPLAKAIKTAMANAKQQGISDDVLKIGSIQIQEGPRLKRGQPVSRGRWHPIVKRMSHIKITLTTTAETKQPVKTKKAKVIKVSQETKVVEKKKVAKKAEGKEK